MPERTDSPYTLPAFATKVQRVEYRVWRNSAWHYNPIGVYADKLAVRIVKAAGSDSPGPGIYILA